MHASSSELLGQDKEASNIAATPADTLLQLSDITFKKPLTLYNCPYHELFLDNSKPHSS